MDVPDKWNEGHPGDINQDLYEFLVIPPSQSFVDYVRECQERFMIDLPMMGIPPELLRGENINSGNLG